VDGFRAGWRVVPARRWIIDFYPTAPFGLGRRELGSQIQLLQRLSWMSKHFGDVAKALFVFQYCLAPVQREVPQVAVPVKGVPRLVCGLRERRACRDGLERLAWRTSGRERGEVDRQYGWLGAKQGGQFGEVEGVGQTRVGQGNSLLGEDGGEHVENRNNCVAPYAA
jgi:hypothetical protein